MSHFRLENSEISQNWKRRILRIAIAKYVVLLAEYGENYYNMMIIKCLLYEMFII